MFSKSKKHKDKASLNAVRSVPSIISADLHIFGNLESAGEVQVDGEVSGDIRSKVLLVGESAIIRGEIIAETVRVHGHVNGQIKAKFVNLAKTANVVGDIVHENLSIQEGAFLEGHITHTSDQELKAMGVNSTAKVQSKDQAQTVSSRPTPVRQNQTGKPAEERVNLVVKVGDTKNVSQVGASAQGQVGASAQGQGQVGASAQGNAPKNSSKAVSRP